ncbi:type VI secretion system baseplate subunit TssK [Pseudomonas guariconensis]|uniref:type VI secretion system baseplate subunit TssK n=1 Tax=Pseudomonas TaxID=286 RepID=UPI002096A74A|nr:MULTISPECIES: type VI secretion system baseplate subunit TssK [Pseudomonas]MCO7639351.1 type VI secretion system baseplate subunit TssK [Pseudomonas sp. S 311-6]MCO7515183.1 type VI secretion system baseplate subunit TssK [Pseudomonas putida]MCO7565055.1 type VI secretion system baseplate subunit TssK [Pseudomonas mosselii]MCO7605060.1 type VI secretion system baseplate subunit TssK [Pseudomonas guariconensis]MCO7616346.1 type VI secretion system baseplate subunit TssK [Pseudomonas guaricon
MKIDRPLWGAGALLSPQQFQQQARWEAWTNECLARMSRAHPWGVQVAAFDLDALRLGKLKATRLRVRMPDGTLIDSDACDRLPPAVALDRLAEQGVSAVTLLLALPLEQANGDNCLLDEGTASRPTRYRRDWREVQDLYGDETQSIAVLEHVLSLRLDSDENAEYLTCPVARVVRDVQGIWTLDAQFVPPLLSFAAQPQLLGQLDNLMTQLAAKRSRLMGMRRESNQRMADFAVADVSLFWLLNALNSYQPVLADLLAHPARHPEEVYQTLVKLAGSLLTFSLEHDIGAIPRYRHEQLEAVFPPLFRLISTLLEASLPSRVIALELEHPSAHRWQVALHDGRLRDAEGVDFYLSVRSSLPAAQVQGQFPRLCKVGAPDDVDHLVNVALDGVPLVPLDHVPAAIPVRLGNLYFALDLNHPKARDMLSCGVCALYVPGTLGEVQLDLFAVLRS